MTPTVSVIIPAFNASKYIKETIDSVQAQSFTDWELIIIDDGSTDNTPEIVDSYKKRDDRIHYFFQKNVGVSESRNNGIKRARGNYIALLDADDYWHPNNLEKKISYLNTHPQVYWIYCDMYMANATSETTGSLVGTDESLFDHLLLWDKTVIPGPSSNLVLRKECFSSSIKFDNNLSTAADQDFCFHLAHVYTGKRIPEMLCFYRILSNSMSRNMTVVEKDHIYVYKKAEANGLFKNLLFKHKCFSNMYLILAGSWWVNGRNKKKGFVFILQALVVYPFNSIKILKKIYNKCC
jgi:glycosyltransferase involved in cell wall biosynthesis